MISVKQKYARYKSKFFETKEMVALIATILPLHTNLSAILGIFK